MKKYSTLFHSALITLTLCFSYATQAVQKTAAQEKHTQHYHFNALTDFTKWDVGDVPYYKDRRNQALGIDARTLEYRGLFATATKEFTGKYATYDITITIMTEEDGEPTYRLLVNNEIVDTYRAPYLGKGSASDLQPHKHTWQNIKLAPGDTIGIASNAHTNGEIPEHGGTAWARGRWQSLNISPAVKRNAILADFKPHSDLFLAQFDIKPDVDDIHSIAALGSMLAHPDFNNINYVAVTGTYGKQEGSYVNANPLMTNAFGRENLRWFDARKDMTNAVLSIRDRARAVLMQGGKVWVQEAGQSDFTAKWLYALSDSGVHDVLIKNNIIVVQHSAWNEKHTTPEALSFVKDKATYQAITDGNKPKKVYNQKNRRGPLTPMYIDAHSRWLNSATDKRNSRQEARALWQQAQLLIEQQNFTAKYSVIPKGGVDFSDTVAAWWIFNLGQPVVSVHAFWQKYVTDVVIDFIQPPQGRLAIVIDGNSPDPDDIGATPVMLALLKQSKLTERLVHLSHSCDLNPFKNKGRQINATDEARRQEVLHTLSAKGIQLFGPFNNLRDYYNCRVDKVRARDDLIDAINGSTSQDPLWIIEAGEPDLIGYALDQADPKRIQHVHVVSHHPANDHSGDFFTWQQILDFGVTEHQIGDQNVALQTPMYHWDWAKKHEFAGYQLIWDMLAYAEQDGVVPFQTNKFDISDAGMIYWWITGADEGGNNFASPGDVKRILLKGYE
ncbi:hypothetical protein [Glaciecola sp. HTCC2999]|jgi:hypothetical protein|uniref:hypothetical protein n=1 Tax=Glaciecola sp. HTCC2999 TaxID=455436 RepID=UPI0000E0E268|nr:hypothetical protein [Glaciecola sp. HTCC2999]